MNTLAFILVILAAFLNPLWNMFLKKSLHKNSFIWCVLSIGAMTLFFVLLVLLSFGTIVINFPPVAWLSLVIYTLFTVLHLIILAEAYKEGDLSLVNPIVSIATVFTLILAIVFLDERMTIISAIGMTSVFFGIYTIHLESLSFKSYIQPLQSILGNRSGMLALLVALVTAIGGFSAKIGIHYFKPILWMIFVHFMLFFWMSIYIFAIEKGRSIVLEWKTNKTHIGLTVVIALSAFILGAIALNISKLSYITFASRLSIFFSVFLGIFVLKEKYGYIKLFASLFIFFGVILISLG